MQLTNTSGFWARAALITAVAFVPAAVGCSSDDDRLGSCQPTAGKGGQGGQAGRGGAPSSAPIGGDTSDAGDGQTGGVPNEDGGRGGTGGGGRAGAAGSAATGGGTQGGGGAGGGNGQGGVGGTGGTAGTGGGGGNLKVCAACQEECAIYGGDPGTGVDACLNGPGVAQAGPAKSEKLSVLCAETLDCFLTSKCVTPAQQDPTACYCGSNASCQLSGMNPMGQCVAEIEASAESAEFGRITERLGDPAYALGRAALVMACYIQNCPTECFP